MSKIVDYSQKYNKELEIKKIIEELICFIPLKFRRGLKFIIFCDTDPKKEGAQGRYYQKDMTINLFLDNIFPKNLSVEALKNVPYFPYTLIAVSLFHEMGHHYYYFINPARSVKTPKKEKLADKFCDFFVKKFFSHCLNCSKDNKTMLSLGCLKEYQDSGRIECGACEKECLCKKCNVFLKIEPIF